MMSEKQMKTLLHSIILLSDTIEALEKTKTRKLVAYSNVKKVFLNLMETPVEPHNNLEVYESNRKLKP
jgi:hypothetical protein